MPTRYFREFADILPVSIPTCRPSRFEPMLPKSMPRWFAIACSPFIGSLWSGGSFACRDWHLWSDFLCRQPPSVSPVRESLPRSAWRKPRTQQPGPKCFDRRQFFSELLFRRGQPFHLSSINRLQKFFASGKMTVQSARSHARLIGDIIQAGACT
jgi:hypothetical protein